MSINFFVECVVDLIGTFVGHFGFDVHLQQIIYCSFELSLNEAELLIDFVAQDLPKHSHIVILGGVILNA